MKMIAHNPKDGVYAATPDYVHAMEVCRPDRFLFVSGTMGLDGNGAAGADLETQLRLIWSNLSRILAEARMTSDNIVRLTSYLRHASYVEANQKARLLALGGRPVPTTAIVVETLRDDWLVEIEVIAAA
ncbi:RidA family protein [Neorhizobium galegae]|uniref:Endoribonuclease L-PSP n=1 Tax=Neorhizobium galegae bv. orientalis str. HAMBI 540 TaxID=1028800 RepID=A0A068SWH9_NEOGA|nr:RidA family protein [Neorhizobium galegae]CDN50662.1 Endoribonuclease L-PSP [Neorhizobium galegae bv. orientalis str. HAMBI 540]CDZ45365.1 Endoribonuclease L-PSP [Neorhizobium galegae bv. orientalis]